MNRDSEYFVYLRIGFHYFKLVDIPTLNGQDKITIMVPWNKATIKEDHGAELLSSVPHYDACVTIPDHINFKQKIGNCYNDYYALKYEPVQGEFPCTRMYLQHVFGEQYEIALDYLAIMYIHPVQILPVLCLVSSERNTGKTTFLKWMKLIFGRNFTLNTNEEFKSRFNSDWTNKIGVGIDETFLDKKEDSERLKNLSTTNVVKTEAKGVDKRETPFFAKFILCSNNETNFLQIDYEEIRYWVRKVPVFQQEKVDMLDSLEKEISAFLFFLIQRGVRYPKKSRMWFDPKDLWTPALQRLKEENASTVEKEMKEIIIEVTFQEVCKSGKY